MPKLRPFKALRYSPKAGAADDLLAPPYDVIGEAEADALRARSPYNCVRLVLPEGGSPDRYEAAAETLRSWRGSGILIEDREPAVYLYAQDFPHGSGRLTRRALVAALQLVPLEAGEVLPHEETHSGPREDRLALTLATGAQLSPVFLVAPDAENAFGAAVEAVAPPAAGPAAPEAGEGGPEASGGEPAAPVLDARTPDGIHHRVWRVHGRRAESLCELAGAGPLLIADGHHRYETALEVAARLGPNAGAPADAPAATAADAHNRRSRRSDAPDDPGASLVLACVVSAGDPGLLLLPTHRTLGGPAPAGGWSDALAAGFEIDEISGIADGAHAGGTHAEGAHAVAEGGRPAMTSPAQLAARVADAGGGCMGMLASGGGAARLLSPRSDALREAGLGAHEAGLAALVFDRLILRPTVGTDADAAARVGRLSYHRDPADSVAAAGAEGAAFLLPPLSVREVWACAARGIRLPPKSTYFIPKVPSGLLFRPISE